MARTIHNSGNIRHRRVRRSIMMWGPASHLPVACPSDAFFRKFTSYLDPGFVKFGYLLFTRLPSSPTTPAQFTGSQNVLDATPFEGHVKALEPGSTIFGSHFGSVEEGWTTTRMSSRKCYAHSPA